MQKKATGYDFKLDKKKNKGLQPTNIQTRVKELVFQK